MRRVMRRATLQLTDAEATGSGRAAFPAQMYLTLRLPKAEPVIDLDFYWFDKPATRMPEALWLTFNPKVADAKSWMLDKSGEPVSPLDVVAGGSRGRMPWARDLKIPAAGAALRWSAWMRR